MLIPPTRQRSEYAARLFRGLADPTRLEILELLREGPMCVGDIAGATATSQPNVSNHLACLKDCGLVKSERRGKNVYYSNSDQRVDELLELADQLLAEVARGVYTCTRLPRREV